MNIFIRELRSYRKFLIFWIISLLLLLFLFISIFPAIQKDADSLKDLMKGFPNELLLAFSIYIDEITSLLGYYAFINTYIILCGAIQAMIIGTGILSKEIKEKTADFLLTKPISRIRILTEKILAALAMLLITNIIYNISSFALAKLYSDGFDTAVFFLMSAPLLFIQIIFFSLGFLLSVILPKIKSVLSLSMGTVAGFFALAAFSDSTGDKPMRYITPLKYYDMFYIMKNGKYETIFVVLSIILVTVFIALSYIIYSKKNIHAFKGGIQ